ncbi:MAG: hypothetical protein MUC95_08535 [Spirochaetes bacterium]|nr:hypothetical protein [Spirochaetota bacterium]
MGKDEVLKLRAVLYNLNKNHNYDNRQFELIHHLYSKIDKLRDASFEAFPAMNHSDLAPSEKSADKIAAKKPENFRYKWITFSRNMSWFIFRYDIFSALNYAEAEIIHDGIYIYLKTDPENLPVTDLLSKYKPAALNHPAYFILINYKNRNMCYSADRLGKRIFSESDVITPKIIPFEKTKKFKGRVRIFGRNHIFL